MREELQRQGRQIQELYQALLRALEQTDRQPSRAAEQGGY
jgi:hypothetical protein